MLLRQPFICLVFDDGRIMVLKALARPVGSLRHIYCMHNVECKELTSPVEHRYPEIEIPSARL